MQSVQRTPQMDGCAAPVDTRDRGRRGETDDGLEGIEGLDDWVRTKCTGDRVVRQPDRYLSSYHAINDSRPLDSRTGCDRL